MLKLVLVATLCATSHARALDGPRLRSRSTLPSVDRHPALLNLRGGEVAAPPADVGMLSAIITQVAMELSKSTTHPAKFFGFLGACCNWFLGLSAVYDASTNGPEVIALPMTLAMLAYSLLFSRWAGWDVTPRNFILSGSHMFNVVAQLNQLRRVLAYKLETQPGAKEEITALGLKASALVATVVAYTLAAPTLKAMMPEGSYLASSGGPFTIHPWPPVTKLFLSAASLTDLHRPTEKISLTQYAALTLTGFIFAFYGLFVTPINYPLTAVNILLFASSAWHLGRKIKADFIDK